MLLIFYFGYEDLYPEGDGSIKRIIESFETKGIKIIPENSAPYRSYLALYLWEILDLGLLDKK